MPSDQLQVKNISLTALCTKQYVHFIILFLFHKRNFGLVVIIFPDLREIISNKLTASPFHKPLWLSLTLPRNLISFTASLNHFSKLLFSLTGPRLALYQSKA
jgi:hypothetical protein